MIYQDKFSPEEIEALEQLHKKGINIDWIIAYIGFESNFDSTAIHPRFKTPVVIKGFYFLSESTAKKFNICSKTLSEYSGVDQLLFLQKLFKPYSGRYLTSSEIVGIMIDPKFINASDNTNVFNSKLQFSYLETKGVLPFKVIYDKVKQVYENGRKQLN